jgi:LCP family protein required for cell wall assembly
MRMSQQRRPMPTPRSPRARRTPAYQLHRRQRLDGVDDNVSRTDTPGDNTPQDTPADTEQSPTSVAAVEPTSVTDHMPDIDGDDAGPQALDASPSAGDDTPESIAAEEHDYAEYVKNVEEAARRSRDGAVVALPSNGPDAVATSTVARLVRRGPVVGHRVSSGAGGRAVVARGDALVVSEPDRRPLLRRPRTWLVIAGIVVGLVAIAAILWSLNLVRLTYNAYNEAHVDPADRTRFTINELGTPVPVPDDEVAAALPNWDNQDPVNILLMGIDYRDGDEEPARSDTMIVVRIDPATKQATMLSLPRDLYVQIPGFDPDRINAAYPLGEEHQDSIDGGGPTVVAQTIEANFDIQIDYFMTIDFDGFREVVDTIGGIVVDVRAPIKDDQYPTEDFGLTRQYFATGLQKMDGETALRYARTRHGDNDIARGDRQQQVLIAIREKAMDLGLITRAEELIRDFGDNVRTDLNFNQMWALAGLGRDVDPNGIVQVNLWQEGVLFEHEPEFEGDGFYLEADWDAVRALVQQHFPSRYGAAPAAQMPTTTSVSGGNTTDQLAPGAGDTSDGIDLDIPVIVQNNAGVDLLATTVSQILIDAGFSNATPETGSEVLDSTVIYDYVGSPETARFIAAQLGLDESAVVDGSGGSAIVVVAGQDLSDLVEE